jgi:hypothetical protein
MQHYKALRIISLILGLAMVGCATSKNQVFGMEIGLKAEAVPEGISLTFDNIPREASRLFISFSEWDKIEEITSLHDIISTYADIRGGLLEQVKNSGKVILPFVKAGHNYSIWAHFQKDDFQDIEGAEARTECTPYSGIYFSEGLKLELNKTHTGVTLSSEPEFSKEVQYAPDKFEYSVKIDLSEYGSLGYSDKSTDGLHWDFEPQMTNDLIEGEYLQSGNYTAYVTAYRNVIYNNVTWAVEIAKTPEFIYSLEL